MNLKNTVIIVVDMQLGNFIGSAPINQGPLLLENTLKILLKGRKFGYPIIFIQNMGGKVILTNQRLRDGKSIRSFWCLKTIR